MIEVSGLGAGAKQDEPGGWESAAFPWTDAAFRPPEVDDVVVYEFDVREWRTATAMSASPWTCGAMR